MSEGTTTSCQPVNDKLTEVDYTGVDEARLVHRQDLPRPPTMSLAQVADFLGVSRRTIYHRIKDGRLQTIRTRNGSRRVLVASLTRYAPPPPTGRKGRPQV